MLSRKRSWSSTTESWTPLNFDSQSLELKKHCRISSPVHDFNALSNVEIHRPLSPPNHLMPTINALRISQMTPPPVDYGRSPGCLLPQSYRVTQVPTPEVTMMDYCEASTAAPMDESPPSPQSDAGCELAKSPALEQLEPNCHTPQNTVKPRGPQMGAQPAGRTPRFRLGYMSGCQKCQMKVPGHYTHV
ncbi:hypothetical protein EX30DRAFT_338484 [Ascodesmis nigricans]|uniref:Uncharacterized protein n=1 Tax=Ascodesmis nigricans TaxID=341454 RepID=A0A4S2N4G8_9PEZI|nr:hypothetical protein EX30DRAFT_338484 [Ascodesmis nigricans]